MAARVAALGVAQIVSWGTLFYAIAVLGGPMGARLGASDAEVYFAFTLALAISALAAPGVGRTIDRHGGGAVLVTGSLLAALAFALMAFAEGLALFAVAWALGGVAMAATLYDAAFATVHLRFPTRYRDAVTALSLIGGFASTVAWPATHALHAGLGLRGALLVFAALHLAVALPIHALFLGRVRGGGEPARAAGATHPALARRLALVSAAFALATFVLTAITAHLAAILAPRGYATETVVRVGMLFGPVQVAARALEWALARRAEPLRAGAAAFALLVAAAASLFFLDGGVGGAMVFAALLGGASGLATIARGTVPAVLARGAPIGEALGRVGRASLVARAVAPLVFAALLDARLDGAAPAFVRDARPAGAAPALVLVALATAALASYLRATAPPMRARAPAPPESPD